MYREINGCENYNIAENFLLKESKTKKMKWNKHENFVSFPKVGHLTRIEGAYIERLYFKLGSTKKRRERSYETRRAVRVS